MSIHAQRNGSQQNQFNSDNLRPTAKRSPSILVTDARNDKVKGARAPFAGQNYKKQQQQLEQQRQQQQQQSQNQSQSHRGNYSFQQLQHLNALQQRFKNKFTDISVDKLLSNSSDIPSGQSRFRHPPNFNRQRYGSTGSSSSSPPPPPIKSPYSQQDNRRNIRSIPKLTLSLPSRTSKTSQKLVLIPEEQQREGSPPSMTTHSNTGSISMANQESSVNAELQAQMTRSRAELMPKEKRAEELSRMTAYFICEEFNLSEVAKFLRKNHEVKPRLYDEALYVPYALPLLPGNEGIRVKSNNTAKLLAKNKFMENMINKNEQTTHLYEYYSGVETPEDANNYSMDPEFENVDGSTPFEPSEPQFFAPPEDEEEEEDKHGKSRLGQHALRNKKSDEPEGTNSKAKTAATNNTTTKSSSSSIHSQTDVSKHHAEMFIFDFGVVVFWNFSEIHEKNILADLAFSDESLLINPIDEQDIETEEFHYEYDRQLLRPRIYNDMITLRSADHLIKLTMSYAIAQLTKLELFESRMVNVLHLISRLPKKLALTGSLGLKKHQLMKKSGKLFKLRVDVNLSGSILDTPGFFWSSEPALHPLYNAVREYLEIDQRVQVLNNRCKVFLEFVDIINDSLNEKNTNRITWMIIVIIFLSLFVSLFELFLGSSKLIT